MSRESSGALLYFSCTEQSSAHCTRAPRWLACPTTGQSVFGPGSYSEPGPPFLTGGSLFPLWSQPWFPDRRSGDQSPFPAWCTGWLLTPPPGQAGLPSHFQGPPHPGNHWQRATEAATSVQERLTHSARLGPPLIFLDPSPGFLQVPTILSEAGSKVTLWGGKRGRPWQGFEAQDCDVGSPT